jgi:translation elongation factor EF-1alpha
LKIKGNKTFNLENIHRGDMVCSLEDQCPVFNSIESDIQFLELNEDQPIVSKGFTCIIHIQTMALDCTIDNIHEIDTKTQEVNKKSTYIKSNANARCILTIGVVICADKFENLASIGRFTLRRDDKCLNYLEQLDLEKY